MEKKEKLNEFSILRAFGALSVIAIHTTSVFGQFEKYSFPCTFLGIINTFCNYDVPLFLFLSVYLLTSNYLKKDELKLSEFYKKRFLKTIPIFILYVIIYYFYLKLNNKQLITFSENPLHFFSSYLLQGSIYHHLYFMPIIFQLYILFPAIYFFTKKLKKVQMPILPNFIITFLALVLFQFIFQQIHKYFIWPYYKNPAIILFTYSLPIGIGVWLAHNYENYKNNNVLKIILLLISTISGYFFIKHTVFIPLRLHNFVLPIYTSSICVVLLCLASIVNEKTKIIKNFLYKIGEHSLTIYFIHPLVLDILRKNCSNLSFSSVIIQFILTLAISYIISCVIKFIKFLALYPILIIEKKKGKNTNE